MNTKSIVSTAKAAPQRPCSAGNAHRTIRVCVRAIADRPGFRRYSGRHRATDAAVARKPVGRSGSRRRLSRKRPEDDRVS